MDFDIDKFREAVMKAHLLICITKTTDPKKQKLLETMVENSTRNMELMNDLLEEGSNP